MFSYTSREDRKDNKRIIGTKKSFSSAETFINQTHFYYVRYMTWKDSKAYKQIMFYVTRGLSSLPKNVARVTQHSYL